MRCFNATILGELKASGMGGRHNSAHQKSGGSQNCHKQLQLYPATESLAASYVLKSFESENIILCCADNDDDDDEVKR